MSETPDLKSVWIAGEKAVKCCQCNGMIFTKGKAQLNTAGMTFLGMDWANKSATWLACNECGFLMWFLKPPRHVKVDKAPKPAH